MSKDRVKKEKKKKKSKKSKKEGGSRSKNKKSKKRRREERNEQHEDDADDAIISSNAEEGVPPSSDANRPSKKKQKFKEEDEAAIQGQRHGFETNHLDHCETPREAYEHIKPYLLELAKKLNIPDPDRNMILWDPYYCDGSAKRHLNDIGFHNVIHENRDFYATIATEKTIPKHHVLITNPPYSDDHIDRLLTYVSRYPERPFCLLMPNWVARKRNYQSLLTLPHFFLSPLQPYTYQMPQWIQEKPEHVPDDRTTTPYLSSWYLGGCNNMTLNVEESLEATMDQQSRQQYPPKWVVAKTVKGLKWKIQKKQQQR